MAFKNICVLMVICLFLSIPCHARLTNLRQLLFREEFCGSTQEFKSYWQALADDQATEVGIHRCMIKILAPHTYFSSTTDLHGTIRELIRNIDRRIMVTSRSQIQRQLDEVRELLFGLLEDRRIHSLELTTEHVFRNTQLMGQSYGNDH